MRYLIGILHFVLWMVVSMIFFDWMIREHMYWFALLTPLWMIVPIVGLMTSMYFLNKLLQHPFPWHPVLPKHLRQEIKNLNKESKK